jgi:myo-inositol 2-dehydrogenase/D-chiro-inositol 1-dehydrogenase
MNTPLKLGLIGAGRIGKVHAASVAYRIPAAQIAAVADVDAQAAGRCAEQYRIPAAVADYRALLDDPAIDAVLICTPTSLHAQTIVDAAAAGKHIFCEKPIDFDLAKVDSALAAAERAGVKLQVGFNRRFDANFARVRQAVQGGEIGTPHLLHIMSRDPAPPPPGYIATSGGILLDMTIHDFDMARFVVGDEVAEIYCAGSVLVDPAIGAAGDLDTVMVMLKFRGGALGVIDNSRQAVYGYDQRLEVLGSAGGASTANVYPNAVTFSTAENVRRDLPLYFFMQRYTESFAVELQAFVDAVRNDTPVPVSGQDLRAATALALAAQRSYTEKRPVRL